MLAFNDDKFYEEQKWRKTQKFSNRVDEDHQILPLNEKDQTNKHYWETNKTNDRNKQDTDAENAGTSGILGKLLKQQ